MSSVDDRTTQPASVAVVHAGANDLETDGGKWDKLCERCAQIPWEGLAKPEIGAVHTDYKIRLDEHFRPDVCRICCLFANVYSSLFPRHMHPDVLEPDDTESPKYRFQRRLLRGDLDPSSLHYDSCWILTDRNPIDAEVVGEYGRSQSACVDFEEIKRWIRKCDDEHGEACKLSSTASVKQLRVIDCVERVIVPAPVDCKFVALSYVWGQNKASREDDAETPKVLPKTIVDAQDVTKRLGYRYLWIDRYCIDQTDVQDKHTQIHQMGAIYSAAQLTIVACAGDDPNYGLPGIHAGTRKFPWLHEQVGHIHIIGLPMSATLAIHDSRWASRAWTYQEGYLSKRRLFFTDRQVVFICNQDILWDGPEEAPESKEDWSLPLGYITDFFPRPAHEEMQAPEEMYGMFRVMEYLVTYSTRALSYDTDALDAIIGILNTRPRHNGEPVYHVSGTPFVAVEQSMRLCVPHTGVWVALNWCHGSPCRRRPNMPSWSPVAWDGHIVWMDFWSRPLVPWDCQITIRDDDRCIDIMQLAQEPDLMADFDGSRGKPLLEITAYTVELPPTTHAGLHQFPNSDRIEPQLVLALDNNTEMVVWPCWDRLPNQENTVAPLFGLILAHDLNVATLTADPPPKIMVLECHGNHYERVGIFPTRISEESQRVQFRSRTMPSLAEHGDGEVSSDTQIWLQHAKKRTILLA